MCCSRGSLSCKSHAMKQTPEQVTCSLWLVTLRSPHISQQLPLPRSSSPPPQRLYRSLRLTRTTPPPPASFSCAPSSSLQHHQVQCNVIPDYRVSASVLYEILPLSLLILCAGALNKSAAAAASIIISSLSYSCDHTQLPHVPQLLMVCARVSRASYGGSLSAYPLFAAPVVGCQPHA